MTLIETLTVATTLAIAVLGLAQISSAAQSLRATGVQKEAALRALDREVATVVATKFTDIPATWNNVGFAVTLEGKAHAALRALPGDGDGLPGLVSVSAPTGDATKLIEVRVRVDWNGASCPQHVLRIVRLAALGAGS